MSEFKEVEDLALSLPSTQRELLAQALWSSLDEAPLTDVEKAWIQEAERRLQDLLDGKTEGIPGDQAVAEIRREFGWQN